MACRLTTLDGPEDGESGGKGSISPFNFCSVVDELLDVQVRRRFRMMKKKATINNANTITPAIMPPTTGPACGRDGDDGGVLSVVLKCSCMLVFS